LNVFEAPGSMSPVSNPPVALVMVCATWSLLATVTVDPGATVTTLGEKAKLWMVMDGEPDGLVFVEVAGPPAFDEQAANTRATPRSAAVAHRRGRPDDLGAMPSLVLTLVLTGRSVRRIARPSKPFRGWMYPDLN
jgi:hypothetical protein